MDSISNVSRIECQRCHQWRDPAVEPECSCPPRPRRRRSSTQQDDVEVVSHYTDADGPEGVQAILLLAVYDQRPKPNEQTEAGH
jgi:hypothetical protein